MNNFTALGSLNFNTEFIKTKNSNLTEVMIDHNSEKSFCTNIGSLCIHDDNGKRDSERNTRKLTLSLLFMRCQFNDASHDCHLALPQSPL